MSNIRFIFGLLAIGISSLSAAELPCEQHYSAGLDKMSEGRYMEASAEFEAAIQLSSTPTLSDTEYLPYVHLAVSNFKAGRNTSARDALVQSQVYGIAPKTEKGSLLIDEYAADIMSMPVNVSDAPLPEHAKVSFHELDQPAVSLSDERVEAIRTGVLKRCALSSALEQNKLPWYFHYEFGRDLMEAGDSQRALDSFVLGANVREDPSRGKRMYGMWFIDYLPYYQIALAHARLSDWKSAHDAIETSKNFGEFSPADPDYEEFSSLESIIASRLRETGS